MKARQTIFTFPASYGQWVALVFVWIATAAIVFNVGTFTFLASNLDASWQAAVGSAISRGDIFGRDIIFTAGPLSSIYTHYFDPTTWVWVVALGFLTSLSMTVSLFGLQPRWMPICLLTMAFATSSFFNLDAALIVFPLLASATLLIRPRFSVAVSLFGAAICGALILAKFTIFFAAVGVFAMIDILMVSQRRIPAHSAILFASLFFSFVYTTGQINSFGEYLKYSIETSSGYTDAMFLWGPWQELLTFLTLGSLFGLAICRSEFRAVKRGLKDPVAAIATICAFGLSLFLGFKAGFVRHDLHSLIAWGVLAILASIAASIFWSSPLARIERVLVALIAVFASAAVLFIFSLGTGTPGGALLKVYAQETGGRIQRFGEMVYDSNAWFARIKDHSERAKVAIKRAEPLPELGGAVDIIPSAQARLIANGLNFRPRFTIQEYATYTQTLISKNRESLRGARAPQFIFFSPGSIDGRHPASSEGALWPDLLSLYEPTARAGDLLVLTRRHDAVEHILGPPDNFQASLNAFFPLNGSSAFIKLDVVPTVFGRLFSFLIKPVPLIIRLRYRDGREPTYRLVAEQAQAGFLILPNVATTQDYLQLYTGKAPDDSPTEAMITAGWWGWAMFRNEITGVRQPLELTILQETAASNPFLSSEREFYRRLELLLAGIRFQPPLLQLVPEGLLAHAPSRIEIIPKRNISFIEVEFGIRDGAWREGNTDGSCFAARSEDGTLLWERCLDPKIVRGDRGPQRAKIPLPNASAKITLETSCRVSCDWDWTYWSAVSVVQ